METKCTSGMPMKGRTWCMIATVLLLFVFAGMLYSLQGPFFPTMARSKGVSAFQYGFVYSAYELTIVLLSIPTGRISYKVGPKTIIITGIFLAGGASTFFGTIKYLNDKNLFFSVALLLRMFEGFGQATIQVGVATLVTVAIPESSGALIAWTESMAGVGLFLGPALGGLLYDLGGFLFPFAVVGTCFFCALPFAWSTIPSYSDLKSKKMEAPCTLWKVLTIPELWFGLFSVSSAMLVPSYCSAFLEPHLLEYSLSGFLKGLVFLLQGLSYAVSAPIFGKLCDMGLNPLWGIVVGNLLNFVGVCLMGPAPFLPIEKSLLVTILGIVVCGIGVGACIAPGFLYLMQSIHQAGFPSNVDTNATMSGMFISALSCGQLIGPASGGFLFDHNGFAIGALCLCVPSCASFVLALSILINKYYF